MPFSILATKLYKPVVRPGLVSRSRLTDRLNAGLNKKLTLISAPAGYGKTTLLSAWAADCKSPIAWLTLDERDNEPVRFWRYIDAALQAVDSQLGRNSRPALFSTRPPAPEQIITNLVNDVAESAAGLILVIEDYHLIDNAEVHASVNYLLDNLPPKMHLIIATRSDPPLQLALRRGRVQISEFRASDLRFTPDEAASFLNQTLQLGLTNEDIASLGKRTEGWVVGLQMAALSLQYEPDRHTFITSFSGDDRHIADYLGEEVLQRQPIDFQNFLIRTSLFDRLSASLCNYVLGREDSQAMLNTLERANLFIQPLDNRREWFRYHPLFAELLQRRLFQTESEIMIKALQRRAVDWLNSNGHFDLAIEHALTCSDFDLAVQLMVSAGQKFFSGGTLNTVLNQAERLPEEKIAENPALACLLAWAAHATGHPQRAEKHVRLIEKQSGMTIEEFVGNPDKSSISMETKAALIEMSAVCARIAVDRFELARSSHIAEVILPYLIPERDHELFAFNPPSALQGPMIFVLGLARKLQGDIYLAEKTFMDSTIEGRLKSNFHIIALSLGHLGETQSLQGRLFEARKTFREALDFPQDVLQSSSFFGMSRIGLGNLEYEWNDLETAASDFQSGIVQGKLWNSWECLLPGYRGLAHLHAARHEWNAAFAALDELEANTTENQDIVHTSAESSRALLNLRIGNLDYASNWADTFDHERPSDYFLAWENNALICCRIWLKKGESEKAEKLLDRIIRDSRQAGRNRHWLEAMCLRSNLYSLKRQHGEAMSTIRSVLNMTEPQGNIRLFVDEGRVMQSLLQDVLTAHQDRSNIVDYVNKILSAFKPATRRSKQASSLIEPLTKRELEVLKLIAEGLSNPQIAKRLYLSTNTLKAHTQNIFSKLNIHTRLQAANKAKELDLID